MAKKSKTYEVQVKVMVDTTVLVSANTYEDAIAKARDLGVKDIVEFDTDFNDGNIAILGIYNFFEEAK